MDKGEPQPPKREEEPIITMENVSLWYDKDKPTSVQALKHVTLDIRKGEYIAFFGPSGCGKTTILYTISGIDRYQEGRVSINGRDITGFSNKELAIFRQTGIGIVFQQFNLVPSLSVVQNVALPMAFLGVSSDRANREALKLLDRLAMGKYANRYPHELSGGQQQRVGIARALANNPPIIIADEPLGNLDSTNAQNVLAFLKELHTQDGRTIIMVTHEAWSLRDTERIFYMKDGEVTKTETHNPDEATARESLAKQFYKDLAAGGMGEKPLEAVSKVLATFLMRGYSEGESKRFEVLVKDRITGKIDAYEFRTLLDTPFRKGGVGLWSHKAIRLANYIEEIISKRKDIDAIIHLINATPELPMSEEIRRIRRWLVEEYEGSMTEFQRAALDEIVGDRIRGSIGPEQFQAVLDKPVSKFGVGMNFRSVQKITERLESIVAGVVAPTNLR